MVHTIYIGCPMRIYPLQTPEIMNKPIFFIRLTETRITYILFFSLIKFFDQKVIFETFENINFVVYFSKSFDFITFYFH